MNPASRRHRTFEDMNSKPPPAPDRGLTIRNVPTGAIAPRLWREVEEIFFLSAARQNFATAQDRQDFLARWTGYYLECEPEGVFLAIAARDRVAGYLTGCADSRGASRLYRDIPHYSLFEDCFEAYPAHFHVNCHPNFRNRGIGTRLVEAYLTHCARAGLPGVHVVTAPGARNVTFYRRCGLDVAVARSWQNQQLLLLARKFSAGIAPKRPAPSRQSR
jgi:GNAT superfamily N-acetyltransferase